MEPQYPCNSEESLPDFSLLFLEMCASWAAMLFTSSVAPSHLTVLPRFLLPSERDSFSLCDHCEAYLADNSLITLHYSVECPWPCNKNVFPLVGQSLGWPAFLVLRFPVQTFSGLVGEAAFTPFFYCHDWHGWHLH